NVLDALAAYLALFAMQFSWLGVALSLVGIVGLAKRMSSTTVVIGLAWLTNVVVVSRAVAAYGEGPELFTPSWMLACLCIGVGAAVLARGSRTRTALVSLGLLSIVLLSTWQNAPAMLARHSDTRHADFAY